MSKFFAQQKLDEAGIVGVSLQKLLIFFMFLDVMWLVLGYSFFGPFMSFLFHFVVLMGVYRRRTSVLLIYGVFNTVMFVLFGLAILFLIGAMMSMPPKYTDDYYASSSSSSYSSSSDSKEPVTYQSSLRYFARTFASTVAPTVSPSPLDSSSNSMSSSDSDMSDETVQAMYIAATIAMVISMVILYCKIYSTVLAFRMRKLLLTADCTPMMIPVNIEDGSVNGDTKPLLEDPAAYENVHPVFNQPGFYPYPVGAQFYPGAQGSAMMPPPFMYGQQPVFYTFAPMPQTEEKL